MSTWAPQRKTGCYWAPYDFGAIKRLLSYGQAKEDNSDNKAKTLQIGASIPTGPTGKVLVEWVKTELSQALIY